MNNLLAEFSWTKDLISLAHFSIMLRSQQANMSYVSHIIYSKIYIGRLIHFAISLQSSKYCSYLMKSDCSNFLAVPWVMESDWGKQNIVSSGTQWFNCCTGRLTRDWNDCISKPWPMCQVMEMRSFQMPPYKLCTCMYAYEVFWITHISWDRCVDGDIGELHLWRINADTAEDTNVIVAW